ncbi:MAG: uroporphyrinogen decarboxylase, partial [Alphaproteobacteria bacterium]
LPEYQAVRKQAGNFLNLCYSPDLAAQVTLQPIDRFDFDAAILFADILLVADGLGQSVRFEDGVGPILTPPLTQADLAKLDPDAARQKLLPVLETVKLVRAQLAPEKALIGFCGAPWTVATYMAAGGPPGEHEAARLWAYGARGERQSFQALIDLLVEVSADYLIGQIEAGADAVQIFDSWAGVLPEAEFNQWVIEPTVRLVAKVRERAGDIPIIGFPRGAGSGYGAYVRETGVSAVSMDTGMPQKMSRYLQKFVTIQGNLDPMALLAGGEALERGVDTLATTLGKDPFVFNLGHGVHRLTPPEHVGALVKRLRECPDPGEI